MKKTFQVQSVHLHAGCPTGYRIYFTGSLEECKKFRPDWTSEDLRWMLYKARSTTIREVFEKIS